MSQSGKRNADEAFQDQGGDLQSKRRRRKSRKTNTAHSEHATLEMTSQESHGPDSSTVLPSSPVPRSDHELKPKNMTDGSLVLSEKSAQLHSKRDAKSMTINDHVDEDTTKISKNKKRKSLATTDSVEGPQKLAGVRRDNMMLQKSDVGNLRLPKAVEKKTTWLLTGRNGGTFINIDPILTEDAMHVIVATRHDVHVYSAATSLLVRSINVTERGDIRTCTVSAASKQEILVGTMSGSLIRFDWTTGRKVSQCKLKSGILHLISAGTEDNCENLLAIVSHSDGGFELLQVSLNLKTTEKSVKSLLQMDYIHSYITISNDLSTIVIFGRDSIHLGQSTKQDKSTFLQQQYSWKRVTAKGRIVSCDARVVEQQGYPRNGHPVEIDVAVGIQNGAVFVYNNILNTMRTKSDMDASGALSSRRLHWHRTAVRALKWSRDGNYLVSGGDESVLVIWQLDTNQKQFLPHLSTSILNITISVSGAHYVLRLADNSVMVLSTADLSPSTNIVGLSAFGQDLSQTTIMHPTEPNHLLSAVSIHAIGANATKEATHLQVYDVDANLQITRQALTRNFISAVNVGPNGQPLREPDVTQMCITSDGKWLATVERWSPNEADMEFLKLKEDQTLPSLECALRIWAWDETASSWNSSVKIDNPHTGRQSTVLAMATNPSRAEFATIAEDGCVKVWTPKTRMRNGVVVRDRAGNSLRNWSCSVTSQIESIDIGATDRNSYIGAMAYSGDGSVVAVHWRSNSTGDCIHLIDSKSGNVVLSQSGLVDGMRVQIQFCGRYLVALSNILTVFDTVTLQVVFNLVLDPEYVNSEGKRKQHLAVDPLTNTIAVGVSLVDHKKPKSHISIFDLSTSNMGPKAETHLSGQLQALLVDSAGNGFVIIDAEAGIRRLTSQKATGASSTDLIRRSDLLMSSQRDRKGLEEIFGRDTEDLVMPPSQPTLLLEGPQASSQSLDDLLRSSNGQTRLAISDLFERVAQAVSSVQLAA